MINSSADWLSAIIRWERLQDKEKEMKEWRLQKVGRCVLFTIWNTEVGGLAHIIVH